MRAWPKRIQGSETRKTKVSRNPRRRVDSDKKRQVALSLQDDVQGKNDAPLPAVPMNGGQTIEHGNSKTTTSICRRVVSANVVGHELQVALQDMAIRHCQWTGQKPRDQ